MRSSGAVIIGGYINGLGLVRAMALRHIPIGVITTQRFDIAHRSRYVSSHSVALGMDRQPELLIELLEQRASDWAGRALFPTNDGALMALSQHREKLSSIYKVIAPSWETARYLLNKNLMLDMAQAVGIDIPHCYGPTAAETAALQNLNFPVIVKPLIGHQFSAQFGCKLFVARNREELCNYVALVEEEKVPCRIYDLIPGADNQIYVYCVYMDKNGQPSAGLTVRKLRQSPPFFGVARVAEVTEHNPTLREATIELLRRIGFRGMAAAEFKWDARDGTFRFMEVNGRSVLYNSLLRQAGLDTANLAWSDYVEGRTAPALPNGWSGVWINSHADILYSTLHRRHERVLFADFVAPYKRPSIDAVWSARDPLPTLAQWSRTIGDGATALLHLKYRELLADRTRHTFGSPSPDVEPRA